MNKSIRQFAVQGFTLIELLIVVIIIAILAAIAIPQFSNTSADAQESSLDANLSTVRSAIELYRIQHGNRYPSVAVSSGATCPNSGVAGTGAINTDVAFVDQLTRFSNAAGQTCSIAGGAFVFGPYLRAVPREPVTNVAASDAIVVVTDAAAAEPATATPGWRFNNVTGRFQMNSNTVARDQRVYSAH